MADDPARAASETNLNRVLPIGSSTFDNLLAYAHAAARPILDKIHLRRTGRRGFNPRDVLLPDGYVAEVVATDLTAPVHCCFDDAGYCYVTESGYKSDSPPRILRIDPRSGARQIFFELPENRWIPTGVMSGCCWHQGQLYFVNTDTLSCLRPDGSIEDLVDDLPGRGDHPCSYPVIGPDGKIYFGVGSVTNLGVVGPDNYDYEWLRFFPDLHDVPGDTITLAGRDFESRDVLHNPLQTVRTGAFVPFGTPTRPNQTIPGRTKCSGSVLRCNLDGSELELVAWGLRAPFGLAFHPDGRLFATEHGIDERGARYIIGDYDDLYEINPGWWYGWPDYASGIRLDDSYWGSGGKGREPVLAAAPGAPPPPFASFDPHVGANGLDFCRDPRFGFEGDAFVALFGDLTPITALLTTPAGFKIARVDMRARRIVDFAVNRIQGPASKLAHEGFERPSHCQFGPDGALYVVDWGEIRLAPEAGGFRVQQGTGSLWRIRRTTGPGGTTPFPPATMPVYVVEPLFLALASATSAVLGTLVAQWLVRRIRRTRR